MVINQWIFQDLSRYDLKEYSFSAPYPTIILLTAIVSTVICFIVNRMEERPQSNIIRLCAYICSTIATGVYILFSGTRDLTNFLEYLKFVGILGACVFVQLLTLRRLLAKYSGNDNVVFRAILYPTAIVALIQVPTIMIDWSVPDGVYLLYGLAIFALILYYCIKINVIKNWTPGLKFIGLVVYAGAATYTTLSILFAFGVIILIICLMMWIFGFGRMRRSRNSTDPGASTSSINDPHSGMEEVYFWTPDGEHRKGFKDAAGNITTEHCEYFRDAGSEIVRTD